MSIIEGTVVRFYTATPFTDIAGVAVTPDVVYLKYQVQGQTEVTYTWTNGNTPPDPTYTIVNDGTGNFYADIDTTSYPGTWTWGWSCEPGVSGLDTTKTQVVWQGEVLISPSSL